ncbi:MAG TPA: catalase family peroxidase [Bryobacteraceae bacterium]|nr:catalase family peroxidase [Bryobacteraceae bacterium]
MAILTQKGLYEEIIDTLNSIFGAHPGYRPVHAKGIVCEAVFQSSPEARSLTRAPHMQGETVPVIVRFSDFSGVPSVRDGDPMASPRGMAIRFQLRDGSHTDIVAHSYNGFPARDAQEFLAFVRALASSGPEAQKPSPLDRFLAEHPAAKRFVEDPKPPPESFATEAYFAGDSFRFTNREGRSRFGRYRILPAAGEKHLDASEAAKRWDNYLFEELQERMIQQSPEFRLAVQLAAEGDPIEDPTQIWPESREQAGLGRIIVKRRLPDSDTFQRTMAFDPAALPDGIEPGDPLIEVRSAVYAIALQRRHPS